MKKGFPVLAVLAFALGLYCLAPIIPPPPGPGGVETEVDPVYVAALDTDGTLAANSDAKVATQKAAKTYSDTKQTAAQVQALIDAERPQSIVGFDALSIRGANIASAATINLNNATGDLIDITADEDISAMTLADGKVRTLRFATTGGNLIHSASLILPTLANIPIFSGDVAVARGYASNVVRVLLYQRANGTALAGPTTASVAAGDAASVATAQGYTDTEIADLPVTASGGYSPVTSASVNLDSDPTAAPTQWLRVGDIVTVAGRVTVDITASATPTSFKLTLPIASNFADTSEAGGTAASTSVAGQVAAIKAMTGGDVTFEWVSIGTASQEMFYSFTYQIVP